MGSHEGVEKYYPDERMAWRNGLRAKEKDVKPAVTKRREN